MPQQNNHRQHLTEPNREEGCCSLFFLKYVLFIFNVLFWFAGLAVLGIGLWTLLDKWSYVSLLSTSIYSITTYLLLATGGITVFIGVVGCCGALRENRCCLMTYAFLLLLVFILEAVTGVLAYIYQAGLKSEMERNLNSTMLKYYHFDEVKTKAIDDLQTKFRCCGARDFEDWKKSEYFKSGLVNQTVPDSCCKTFSDQCAKSTSPSNINYDSCMSQLVIYVKEHLVIIGATCIGISGLQLFGIIFSCCMACMVKSYRVTKY